MFYCISVQTPSFFRLFLSKFLILYGKTMKHLDEEMTIPEVTSWPVLDPDLATPGHLRWVWPRRYKNMKESKFFFRILF